MVQISQDQSDSTEVKKEDEAPTSKKALDIEPSTFN